MCRNPHSDVRKLALQSRPDSSNLESIPVAFQVPEFSMEASIKSPTSPSIVHAARVGTSRAPSSRVCTGDRVGSDHEHYYQPFYQGFISRLCLA